MKLELQAISYDRNDVLHTIGLRNVYLNYCLRQRNASRPEGRAHARFDRLAKFLREDHDETAA